MRFFAACGFDCARMLTLPGTSLTVSPLCLGGVPFGNTLTETETFALLDHFVALGGNFIDTARIYSDWVPGEKHRSERILGDWVAARGLRAQLVIATKGAHPLIEAPDRPRTSADELRTDLEGSLRSLRTDVIDLYWLHRDDRTRPVAHFIDVLNRFLRAGKIRAFGASNWSATRLRAAHQYARQTGQQGFSANQPYWCLGVAQSRPPGFTGYVKFAADAYRLHEDTGIAVVPYTSQANGFFSKLARGDAGLADHIFHVPANLAAGRVVQALAAAKRVPPGAVVLAYLWSGRPFPVVPIVGSRTAPQLAEAFAARSLQLTRAEVAELESASQSGLPVPA